MKKAEILSLLQNHIRHGNIRRKGVRIFAQFLHWWLGKIVIKNDEKYDFYDVVPFLPQLALDAWETMRTSTGEIETKYRQMLEAELKEAMVNITDLGEANILHQNTGMFIVGYVLAAIAGDRVRQEAETYCRAQSIALQVMFDKFIREVYRNGLFKIIQADGQRGMNGRFGATELRTWVCAGRTIFTFARPKKKGAEVSISFVAGDDDDLALEAGIQSIEANLPTAFNMIEDVIARWPRTKREQKQLFKGNENVAPLAVHVARTQTKAEE